MKIISQKFNTAFALNLPILTTLRVNETILKILIGCQLSLVLIIHTNNVSNPTNRYWDMAQDW